MRHRSRLGRLVGRRRRGSDGRRSRAGRARPDGRATASISAACRRSRCSQPRAMPTLARRGAALGVACARAADRLWRCGRQRAGRSSRAIAPNNSVERFERLGVKVIRAEARFTSPRAIRAGERRDPAAAVRRRHRLAPGDPADTRPRPRSLSDKRDGLRQPRPPRASDRDRRRPDRHRNGAGPPPARGASHRARYRSVSAARRPGARRVLSSSGSPQKGLQLVHGSRSRDRAGRRRDHRSARRGRADRRVASVGRRRAAAEHRGARSWRGGDRGDREEASPSMPGCARPTAAHLRSAMSRADRNSPISPIITPGS